MFSFDHHRQKSKHSKDDHGVDHHAVTLDYSWTSAKQNGLDHLSVLRELLCRWGVCGTDLETSFGGVGDTPAVVLVFHDVFQITRHMA